MARKKEALSSSRILCLNLVPKDCEPALQLKEGTAEAFLRFSPRVQFRQPGYIFLDVGSTLALFKDEQSIFQAVLQMGRSFAPQCQAAIANTSYVAQALSQHRPNIQSKPSEERDLVASLPITALQDMEGLQAWVKPSQIEYIVSFFKSLGFQHLEEIMQITLASWRERWGELGTLLWNRLQGKDKQPISPLLSQEALEAYGHFDHSVSDIPLLMQKIDVSLSLLFSRLEGLARFAERMQVRLFCEYSDAKHLLEITPVTASRDRSLFRDLLIQRLEELDLENPIHEYEIHIFDVAEKIQQLDFFEPRNTSDKRWRRLISMAQQSGVQVGFLEPQPSHFPERSYQFKNDLPQELNDQDQISWSEERAIQVKTSYAKGLSKSPRPSLLFLEPQRLSKRSLQDLKFLSSIPIERIESSWWETWTNKDQEMHKERDYFFALSQEGQLLWVYQDKQSEDYYLHGYFD